MPKTLTTPTATTATASESSTRLKLWREAKRPVRGNRSDLIFFQFMALVVKYLSGETVDGVGVTDRANGFERIASANRRDPLGNNDPKLVRCRGRKIQVVGMKPTRRREPETAGLEIRHARARVDHVEGGNTVAGADAVGAEVEHHRRRKRLNGGDEILGLGDAGCVRGVEEEAPVGHVVVDPRVGGDDLGH